MLPISPPLGDDVCACICRVDVCGAGVCASCGADTCGSEGVDVCGSGEVNACGICGVDVCGSEGAGMLKVGLNVGRLGRGALNVGRLGDMLNAG